MNASVIKEGNTNIPGKYKGEINKVAGGLFLNHDIFS